MASLGSRVDFSEWLQEVISSYTKFHDEEKNFVLESLILASGPSQLYSLTQKLKVLVFRDFISCLPPEIVICILQYLGGKQILLCCQVCKSWNTTINCLTQLWWCLAQDAGADVYALDEIENHLNGDTYTSINTEQASLMSKGIALKRLYLHTIKTVKGFSSGRSIQIIDPFVDKGSWRITSVKYLLGRIVTGSDDHTVQIWTVPYGSLFNSLSTHSVSSLTLTNQHLYIASFNANAESWDLTTRQLTRTFCGHTSAVLAIDVSVDEAFILTGSVDKTAKLWNLRTTPTELLKTLSGHLDWVIQVKFVPTEAKHILFVTCDSSMCKLWLMTTVGDLIGSCQVHSDSPLKFTSFYHLPHDLHQMFTCQWEERSKSPWLSKYLIQSKSCTIKRKLHLHIPLEAVKGYLLGAGKKFAVIMCSISRKDFYVFDILQRSVIATIATPDFFMLTRNGSTVTLCDTHWLDGFRFSKMKKDTPVFAATVERSRVILGTWAEHLNEFTSYSKE